MTRTKDYSVLVFSCSLLLLFFVFCFVFFNLYHILWTIIHVTTEVLLWATEEAPGHSCPQIKVPAACWVVFKCLFFLVYKMRRFRWRSFVKIGWGTLKRLRSPWTVWTYKPKYYTYSNSTITSEGLLHWCGKNAGVSCKIKHRRISLVCLWCFVRLQQPCPLCAFSLFHFSFKWSWHVVTRLIISEVIDRFGLCKMWEGSSQTKKKKKSRGWKDVLQLDFCMSCFCFMYQSKSTTVFVVIGSVQYHTQQILGADTGPLEPFPVMWEKLQQIQAVIGKI